MAAAFLNRAQLRATFRFALVEHGGVPRLDVSVAGEVPARPLRGSPLRARRLLELVARRTPGTLLHRETKCFSFALAQHDALLAALARPAAFLPAFSRLYAESPLALPPDVAARRPGESDYAFGNRTQAALRAEQQSEYEQLGSAVVRVEPLPAQLARYLADPANAVCGPTVAAAAATAAPAPAPAHVPRALWALFYPYQRDGVAFLIARRRALLCDEMGCGKTKQATAAALHFYGAGGGARPVIVVAPSSLKETWRREFDEWARDAAVVGPRRGAPLRVQVLKKGSDVLDADGGVIIVSYDLSTQPDLQQRLLATNPCVVVLDEAHYIKNPATRRTNACVALGARAPHFFALSGTPALARHYDLYTQLSLVLPRVFADRDAYGARYCAPEERHIGRGRTVIEYRGAERAVELRAVLRTVMVRRLKRDVLAHLPAKTRERVFLALDDAKKAEVTALRANADALKRAGASLDASNAALLEAVRHTARVKIPAALRYIDDVVLAHDAEPAAPAPAAARRVPKFIVFAHHLEVLDAVEAHLAKRGLRTLRIDGSTSDEARASAETRFQDPGGDIDAAILSITAAGLGLTLTAASLALFLEMHFTFALNNQAEDRVHRITQTQPVTVRYLLASGTTDEFVWAVNAAKFSTVSALLDGERAELHAAATAFAPAAGGGGGAHVDKKQRL